MSYQEPNSGYERLEGQISWYDAKSGSAQRCFKNFKYYVFIASALIPIAALAGYPVAAAFLGASIAFAEAIQQLNQWQHNWITYRSTCEALRHEKFAYIERADPYDGLNDAEARKLLAQRVESLISTEHSKWIATQEKSADTAPREEPRPARAPN